MTTKPKYSGTRMDPDLRHALYLIAIFVYFAVRFATSPIGGQNPNAPSASAAGWGTSN